MSASALTGCVVSSLGSDLSCFKSNNDIKMWHFLSPRISGVGLSSAVWYDNSQPLPDKRVYVGSFYSIYPSCESVHSCSLNCLSRKVSYLITATQTKTIKDYQEPASTSVHFRKILKTHQPLRLPPEPTCRFLTPGTSTFPLMLPSS